MIPRRHPWERQCDVNEYFNLSSVTTQGGRRPGGGRKPKRPIEQVEAAAARPDDAGLQRLADIQQRVREHGYREHGYREHVLWFSRVLRELKGPEEAKVMAKPHPIEVVDIWENGERVIIARNPGRDEPFMTLRTASLCPNCVSTALRDVLELYEADARVAR